MVLGCGAFRRWLGHEAGALIDGINALVKGTPECSLPCGHVRTPQEDSQLWTRKPYSPFTKSASTLILDFQLPELWKINVWVFAHHPIYDILLKQPEWTKTPNHLHFAPWSLFMLIPHMEYSLLPFWLPIPHLMFPIHSVNLYWVPTMCHELFRHWRYSREKRERI